MKRIESADQGDEAGPNQKFAVSLTRVGHADWAHCHGAQPMILATR